MSQLTDGLHPKLKFQGHAETPNRRGPERERGSVGLSKTFDDAKAKARTVQTALIEAIKAL